MTKPVWKLKPYSELPPGTVWTEGITPDSFDGRVTIETRRAGFDDRQNDRIVVIRRGGEEIIVYSDELADLAECLTRAAKAFAEAEKEEKAHALVK